jgi:mannose-6-phosphate isomerase-like protein (cupin superfamily)
MDSQPEGRPPITRNGSYAPVLTDEDISSVRIATRRDWLRQANVRLPGYDTFGYQRISFLGLDASFARSSVLYIPPGQRTPVHDSRVQHLVYAIEGETEWLVAGERHVLEPLGILFLPADVMYEVRNQGAERALLLSIIAPGPLGWPDEGDGPNYHEVVERK